MDDGPRTSDATRESGRTLAQEIIEAYGGMKRWNRVSSLRVDIAFAGFAFRMKFLRNLPYRGTMVVERAVQRLTFESFPVPGHRGVFEGTAVRTESVDGRLVSRRLEPLQVKGDLPTPTFTRAADSKSSTPTATD